QPPSLARAIAIFWATRRARSAAPYATPCSTASTRPAVKLHDPAERMRQKAHSWRVAPSPTDSYDRQMDAAPTAYIPPARAAALAHERQFPAQVAKESKTPDINPATLST